VLAGGKTRADRNLLLSRRRKRFLVDISITRWCGRQQVLNKSSRKDAKKKLRRKENVAAN